VPDDRSVLAAGGPSAWPGAASARRFRVVVGSEMEQSAPRRHTTWRA